MTDQDQQASELGKKPTHIIYAKAYISKQPVNVRVGVAWKHSKGDGFNIQLDQMVAFVNKPKADQD
jgi:hypothetical protein